MGSDEEDDSGKDKKKKTKKIKEKYRKYRKNGTRPSPFGPETLMTSSRRNMVSSTRVLPITGKITWQ